MSSPNERGATTLLVTSLLLIATLALATSSYKSVIYQIKRAQNEVKVRQAHWRAEGGIECVYAYYHTFPEQLSSVSLVEIIETCQQQLALESLYVESLTSDNYVIHAVGANQHIQRRFDYRQLRGMGAIQSNANLRLIGNITISPDPSRKAFANGTYPCIAVRYLSHVSFETVSGVGGLSTRSPSAGEPYPDFDGECSSDYQTSIVTDQATSDNLHNFKRDYVKDDQIDPFKNYFNTDKTEQNIVQIKQQYQIVSLPTVQDGHHCAEVISTKLSPSNNKLWIEGHCIVTTPLKITWPASLVVEGGIFSATGANVYAGSFFHLVDMNSLEFSVSRLNHYWQSVDHIAAIEPWLEGKTIYFDDGSFHPKGGMYFDALGAEVILKGAYALGYTSSNNPIEGRKGIYWLSGGWYAP